jgi:anti-sigma B factor antagonist
MIEINVEAIQPVAGTSTTPQGTVVKVTGEIDAISAAAVQQKILPLSVPGCKIILDMSKVAYMSSAGLRMLLSVYRQISGNKGKVVLLGLSDELKETMSMTGFLGYFTVEDSLELALQVISQ